MFWGLVLEPGKRYSTTVDKSFHVSMAALDCSSVKSDSEILSVILESDGQENILCNLTKQQRLLQSHLDLNFMTGDKLAFEIKGNGIVHLSGYFVPEEDDDDFMNMPGYEEDGEEEEDEEEESEVSPVKIDKGKGKAKRKPQPQQLNENKAKKLKVSEDSDDDSDEEDDDGEENATGGATVDSSDEDEEEDDDTDEEEDDDSDEEDEEMADSDEEEEEVPVLSKKQQKTPQSLNKKASQTPNKQTPSNKQQQQSANKQNATTPLVNGSSPNQQQSGKKNKKKGNQGQDTPKTPAQNDTKGIKQKTPGSEAGTPQQKKKLEGGILIKDIKEGNGPIAKNGQMVSVYYQGRLKSNNKMFDECKRGGPAFKFRLGKGEVIKGWDIGVNGMKVGGVRSITCPPNMAYGQKGSPPTIPPNSALTFQVELKAVN